MKKNERTKQEFQKIERKRIIKTIEITAYWTGPDEMTVYSDNYKHMIKFTVKHIEGAHGEPVNKEKFLREDAESAVKLIDHLLIPGDY